MEQILLLIFTLMLFVGLAGGNPGMVLKPIFEIASQLIGTILSLVCSLLLMLFRALLSLLAAGVQALASATSRNINR